MVVVHFTTTAGVLYKSEHIFLFSTGGPIDVKSRAPLTCIDSWSGVASVPVSKSIAYHTKRCNVSPSHMLFVMFESSRQRGVFPCVRYNLDIVYMSYGGTSDLPGRPQHGFGTTEQVDEQSSVFVSRALSLARA